LSTDGPSLLKPTTKVVKRTIRGMLPAAKVYGTTGRLTAAEFDRLDNAVLSINSLSTKATAPKVRSSIMAVIRSLEDRLTKHQLSSARIISALQKARSHSHYAQLTSFLPASKPGDFDDRTQGHRTTNSY